MEVEPVWLRVAGDGGVPLVKDGELGPQLGEDRDVGRVKAPHHIVAKPGQQGLCILGKSVHRWGVLMRKAEIEKNIGKKLSEKQEEEERGGGQTTKQGWSGLQSRDPNTCSATRGTEWPGSGSTYSAVLDT